MPHANRSRDPEAPQRTPTWTEVRAARDAAGLTVTECARLVFITLSAWSRYEANPANAADTRTMPAATWWLFRLRVGQAKLSDLPRAPRPGTLRTRPGPRDRARYAAAAAPVSTAAE